MNDKAFGGRSDSPKYSLTVNTNFSLLSDNDQMGTLISRIPTTAKTNAVVLLLGETGTGKEYIAEAIHRYSERTGEFIKVNCASIPESLMESELFGHSKGAFTGASQTRPGKFKAADQGTIFLDEITKMDIRMQGKLLRAIEYGYISPLGLDKDMRIDIRVICACSKDEIVKKLQLETVLPDLYYRISSYILEIPSLRQRKEDLPRLIQFFIKEQESSLGVNRIDAESITLLQDYQWMGNLRELRSAITAASINACARNSNIIESIDFNEFPSSIINNDDTVHKTIGAYIEKSMSNGLLLEDFLSDMRQLLLVELRRRTGGDAKEIAQILGKSVSSVRTLYSKAGLKIRNH